MQSPHDYLGLFGAPDHKTAARVVDFVRSFGHATMNLWPATPWDRCLDDVAAAGA